MKIVGHHGKGRVFLHQRKAVADILVGVARPVLEDQTPAVDAALGQYVVCD